MNQILSMGEDPQKKENEVKTKIKRETKVERPIQMERPVQVERNTQDETIDRVSAINKKAEISKIIKIFCISIILFGLILAGESTYAIIKNGGEKGEDNVEITTDRMGKETKITVTSEQYPIKEFTYRWNDGEPVKIGGNGTLSLETVIQIPNGNNILRMTVTDNFGNEKNFHKQYLYDSSDVDKPSIDMAITGVRLEIKATDNVAVDYITYGWNDNEPTRVEPEEDNSKEINVDIEVPSGQNKLSIVAVDKEGNRETRTENIIGDTKPTYVLSKDGTKIILKAQDDEGIKKVIMTIDGETRDSGEEPLNKKEVSVVWEVTKGTHNISYSVENVNGLISSGEITAEI